MVVLGLYRGYTGVILGYILGLYWVMENEMDFFFFFR